MTTSTTTVIGGVDTHKHTHYAAVIDTNGRLLGHQQFRATDAGDAALRAWMRSHGELDAIGVGSTGSFGATLTRSLTAPAPGSSRRTARTGPRDTATASPTGSMPSRSPVRCWGGPRPPRRRPSPGWWR